MDAVELDVMGVFHCHKGVAYECVVLDNHLLEGSSTVVGVEEFGWVVESDGAPGNRDDVRVISLLIHL